jgi:putative component of toxin-antitoxin plasmid stabilization module
VGDKMIVLLVGGDKSSQTADIEKAKLIGSKIKNDGNYKI